MYRAFVHDWIFHIGGAEAVFFDIIKTHISDDSEEAIYTLFSDKEEIEINGYHIPIITALPRWINDVFVRGSKHGYKLLDYRNLIVFYPQLCRLLRQKIHKSNATHIYISSFAAVKNIIPYGAVGRTQAYTSLYLHSPNQYIRENYDEYITKISARQRVIFKIITPYLRTRDSKPRYYNQIATNSEYTKQCAIKRYKNGGFESARVVYPQIPQAFFSTSVVIRPKEYFCVVGRLTKLVREVDRIIHMANDLDIPLLIVGSGPDEGELKRIAGPSVRFVGNISDIDQKITILKHARGLINLAKESCGIATMEALSLGVPVFGYSVGGTAEFVDETNGLLVDNKDHKTLVRERKQYNQMQFDRTYIQKNMIERLRNED